MGLIRHISLLLILFVCCGVVVSAGNTSIELNLNEEKEVSGISVIFKAFTTSDEAMLTLNGKTAFVEKDTTQKVSGVGVTLTEMLVSSDESRIWLTLDIPFTCGDDTCDDGEQSFCCTDCGCVGSDVCLENQCVAKGDNECVEDADCIVEDSCSIGICEGVPRKCVYLEINECKHDDGCCPTVCTEYKDDHDCTQYIECTTQEDCDDGDATTKDSCSEPDGKCYNTPLSETELDDQSNNQGDEEPRQLSIQDIARQKAAEAEASGETDSSTKTVNEESAKNDEPAQKKEESSAKLDAAVEGSGEFENEKPVSASLNDPRNVFMVVVIFGVFGLIVLSMMKFGKGKDEKKVEHVPSTIEEQHDYEVEYKD